MKEKIIVLLAVLILLISGCQSKDIGDTEVKETEASGKTLEANSDKGNESENRPSEETEPSDTEEVKPSFTLNEIFPYEKNFTWYYEGAVDYGRYETIMNIEEALVHEKAKYIYIEGEIDDPSGGQDGDLSFVKKYKITDESIELIYDENNSCTILKAPLKKGSSWTGTWLNQSGLFTGKITITEVTDKGITTELVPERPKEDGIDNRYKIITKYEIGKGIVGTETFYPQGDGTYQFPIWLSKTSLTAPQWLISRYIEPSEKLKGYYQHDNVWYEIIMAKEKQWTRKQKDNLNDEKIISRYKTLLESLSKDDLKSISLAKEVGQHYCTFMNETAPIIHLFEKFYEDTISHLEFEFPNKNGLDYEKAEKIFWFDEEKGVFENRLSVEDPLLRAKALVLHENGVIIGFDEGMPFLCPDMDYIMRSFRSYASDLMKDYLMLKKWKYRNTPLFSDGVLTVTWDELSGYIAGLEKFYNKYLDTDEAKWAKTEAEELFVLYAVPTNYIHNSSKYMNGILSPYVRESYERFIVDYPDSDYSKKIERIYENLKENQFMYNEKLEEFLKELGFQPRIDKRMSNRIKEYNRQLEDFKQIVSRAVEGRKQDDKELESITVETVDEFMNAIGSNRKILVKPGTYILPYKFSSEFVDIEDGEVNINNAKNLIIEGLGESPVTLVSEAYGYVLSFPDCENISLINLRMGHTKEFCKAGVIKFGGKNITIDRCILFGCGEWGITTSGVVNMQVTNTLISDCVTQAATLYKSKEIVFNNCIFTRNSKTVVLMLECDDVLFKGVDIVNNNKEDYEERDVIFYMEKSENIGIESCTIKENGTEKLSEGDAELRIVE